MTANALVCLTASSEWYGKAIRRITHSNVNHAFIAYDSPLHGGWQALQTDERGLVEVPVENVKHNYIECYSFSDLDILTALPLCRDLVGDSYDWIGIAGFLLKIKVWRMTGKKIVNPLHAAGELFCSEFSATFLQRVEGMYDWMRVVDPSGIAPGGTRKYLGVPSLQELLQRNAGVVREDCPFLR
ncbi:MAG: hypothetical protein DRJ03_24350 [Chloroflexi bacterium]|nr:MAG: hypothetical protein DRJ03_24350 [Chloroflexota bacterium]